MTRLGTPGSPARPTRQIALVAGVAALLVGGATSLNLATTTGGTTGGSRGQDALVQDWQARSEGQQVLGGARTPGVPSIQRMRHDNVGITVTVAPSRPGPNLVRVDQQHLSGKHVQRQGSRPVLVGTGEDNLVRARPRPGADGLWAVVDLPEGTGTVLVTHGRRHRVPFAVETGTTPADASWTGADGPECLTAATAAILAGGSAPDTCPASSLSPTDEAALRFVVDTLDTRGVEQLAVQQDGSARSDAAQAVVRDAAEAAGIAVVAPEVAPKGRSALLVLSGWADAASSLERVTALPVREQPLRTDGTWLAPWLLTPTVVDSTLGAVLALDFDIRAGDARAFSDVLSTYLPGQAPTSSAFLAWRAARSGEAAPLTMYAASRAAYMPKNGSHVGHETEVAWFPGGTVTPIGSPES